MPPPSNAHIVRIILPTGNEISAYIGNPSGNREWRNSEDDSLLDPFRDGEQFTYWTNDPVPVKGLAYWSVSAKTFYTGVNNDPVDRQISQAEYETIDLIDLRKPSAPE